VAKTKPAVKHPASAKLTKDELALQERRGRYYRKLVREAVQSFTKGVDKNKVGILLSGGVDSTITLWTLLELNIRPYVYTFHLSSTEGLSSDAQKAQTLAEKYGLPFRVIEMPTDPDTLAKQIYDLDTRYPGLESRPDFEVVPIFEEIIREARDRDGVTHVFSGIGDSAIHLLGRKMEIRGRYGRMGISETNARRMLQVENGDQTEILTSMANDLGSQLCLPLQVVAVMQPYYDVPWHVMNTPRLKHITLNQFAVEEANSGIKVVVAPMQNGDSGGRAYYDSMIPASQYAHDFVGREVTSAIVYYNALRSRYRKRESTPSKFWDWYSYVTDGIELPEGYKVPVDMRTGKTILPESAKESEGEGLFDDIMDDGTEFKLDENGEIDRRADCFGNPFYEGDDAAMTSCPRAQAGLCSKYNPDARYAITKCEIWDQWNGANVEFLKTLAEATAGQARETYLEWAERAEKVIEDIKNDQHSFS